LSVESSVLFGIYVLLLLFGMKQRRVYVELLCMTGLWPMGGRRVQAKTE